MYVGNKVLHSNSKEKIFHQISVVKYESSMEIKLKHNTTELEMVL